MLKESYVDYFFNDFIHQVVGNIYYCFLEHITQNITTRFNSKLIGTYHKAIQVLRDDNPEVKKSTRLPAICVDPTLPINIEEKSRQLWRTPVAAPLSKRLYDPIYQDEDLRITPGFVRYESSVSVYMWFDSIYEMIDIELRFLQAFHGTERWSKPYGMNVLCPVPEQLYTYDNPDGFVINWPDKYTPKLLNSIGKEIPMFSIYLAPMVKLNSFGDIGTRDKDSGDDLGNCRLQADFTFEFEVPTFYIVDTYWPIRYLQCAMGVDGVLTDIIFLKEIQLQADPDSPVDPDNGIITPEDAVKVSETPLHPEDIQKWQVYVIENDNYIYQLPTVPNPVKGYLVIYDGRSVDNYYINRDDNTIEFSSDSYKNGDIIQVIVY